MAKQLRENLLEMSDDEDFVEAIEILRNARRRRKRYRDRIDHFLLWNDDDFIRRFRLSKQGVRFVVNQIEAQIKSRTEWNHAVTAEQMVLVTLRYYATGNFLQTVGDFVGIDKGTASRIVCKVTRAIAGLYHQFIKLPKTPPEFKGTSQEFYTVARFPKCIGALDCTHVKISSPGGNNAEIFRNRKGFFSFNVQAICDANCMFQDVVCRWPGSTHDSHIFANSNVRARFEQGVFNEYVLVGDSGYAIKNYLITPLHNPVTRQEQLFNESQIRTRNCIERKFGQWKRRFPILAFGIRFKVEKVEAVVIATAVLDNIAKLLNEVDPPVTEEEEAVINLVSNVNDDHPDMNVYNMHDVNNIVRHQLINYFNDLALG
nr:unnamed protein product [Callosobruchus chinensis]